MTDMSNQTTKKGKMTAKTKLVAMFIMLALMLCTVVSSTVAWMTISRTPIVSDLTLTVMTMARLEIAPDVNGAPGEWGVQLDLSTVLENLSPLKPITYSKVQDRFFAMDYGQDGRADGTTIALTDELNANVISDGSASGTKDGYYLKVEYWLRAPSTARISLSEAKEVEEGTAGAGTFLVGNPVWNGQAVRHENGGNGMETTVRIGLRCQTTDLKGNPIGAPRFVIYEPNADTHADGSTGYVETESIDGGTGLVPAENLIWQTTSTWNEDTPVLSSNVVYTLGEFRTAADLFDISENTLEKITMYVWVEGNDIDCINAIAANPTSLLGNLQFTSNDKEIDTGIDRDPDNDALDGFRPEPETEPETTIEPNNERKAENILKNFIN